MEKQDMMNKVHQQYLQTLTQKAAEGMEGNGFALVYSEHLKAKLQTPQTTEQK